MEPNDRLNASDSAEIEGTGPERTCILTRACRPKEQLIRLALGPDGSVAPDVRARAGGRGAWIGVGRKAFEEASSKGKLKPALARALRTPDFVIPAQLPELIEAALRQAALDRLGLEARGGSLVTGGERIEQRSADILRTITGADLFEVSAVTVPAYPAAQIEARNWGAVRDANLQLSSGLHRTLSRWRA